MTSYFERLRAAREATAAWPTDTRALCLQALDAQLVRDVLLALTVPGVPAAFRVALLRVIATESRAEDPCRAAFVAHVEALFADLPKLAGALDAASPAALLTRQCDHLLALAPYLRAWDAVQPTDAVDAAQRVAAGMLTGDARLLRAALVPSADAQAFGVLLLNPEVPLRAAPLQWTGLVVALGRDPVYRALVVDVHPTELAQCRRKPREAPRGWDVRRLTWVERPATS